MWKYGPIILTFLSCACAPIVSHSQNQGPVSTPAPQASAPAPPTVPKGAPTQAVSEKPVEPVSPGEYVGDLYKLGLGWHPAALQNLPKDKYGLADWVEIMNRKLIAPRNSVDRTAPEFPPFNLEIVMPTKTGLIEGAHFPHSTHTLWLNCVTCHDKIFIPKIGANNLTMARIAKGEACGVCHGKVSFPLNHCERCHVPAPPKVGRSSATKAK